MDLFKKRIYFQDVMDVDYEIKMDNTREMLRVCMKKCASFHKAELTNQEQICMNNCSSMLFFDFLRKYHKK